LRVKKLSFGAAREDMQALYSYNKPVFQELREQSLSKLEELGYQECDPWHLLLDAEIESAYGGLLLALVPNLLDLQFAIRPQPDHIPNSFSTKPFLDMYGTTAPANCVLPTLHSITKLSIPATHASILQFDIPNLTILRLNQMTISQLRRICIASNLSAPKVKELYLGISLDISDETSWTEICDLGRFFTALGWTGEDAGSVEVVGEPVFPLTSLSIELWGPVKDAAYEYEFQDGILNYQLDHLTWQLEPTYPHLENLSIKYTGSVESEDILWMLDCAQQVEELVHFTSLKRLVLYDKFLNGLYDWGQHQVGPGQGQLVPIQTHERLVRLLPSTLEELEVIAPTRPFLPWLKEFLQGKEHYPNLRKLIVHVSTYLINLDYQQNRFATVADFRHLSGQEVWEAFTMAGISVIIHGQEADDWYPVA
jgi:hypothetical protein